MEVAGIRPGRYLWRRHDGVMLKSIWKVLIWLKKMYKS